MLFAVGFEGNCHFLLNSGQVLEMFWFLIDDLGGVGDPVDQQDRLICVTNEYGYIVLAVLLDTLDYLNIDRTVVVVLLASLVHFLGRYLSIV